jgi:catalase
MFALHKLFLPLALTAAIGGCSQPPEQKAALAPAATKPDLDVQFVDAFNARYGVHPGYRSNHAKGVLVRGNFKPTPAAATLSVSPIFAGATVPVTVRFSDGGGLPHIPDTSPDANPHGMSIKFQLPDGEESDIVAISLRIFTVATPEDFLQQQLAAATNKPGEPPSPQFMAFLKSHPTVLKAVATLTIPASFAEENYFGVNAFIFINSAGKRQPFRYFITPEKVVHLSPEDAAKRPRDFLVDEIPKRIAKQPVVFHLTAQLAAPGDQTKDGTQSWPDDRPVVDLGTITLDQAVADSDVEQKKLLFTPGRLTDGIEPSDDPMIAARDGAYAESFKRRSPADVNSTFQREATKRENADKAAAGEK